VEALRLAAAEHRARTDSSSLGSDAPAAHEAATVA
jgi:hypothetical protein